MEFLNAINPLPTAVLADTETRVLAEFLLLEEKFKYNRFSKVAKRKVLERLEEKYDWKLSPINLNTKIYSLISKDFLARDEDGIIFIKPYLIKMVQEIILNGKIEIKVVFECNGKE